MSSSRSLPAGRIDLTGPLRRRGIAGRLTLAAVNDVSLLVATRIRRFQIAVHAGAWGQCSAYVLWTQKSPQEFGIAIGNTRKLRTFPLEVFETPSLHIDLRLTQLAVIGNDALRLLLRCLTPLIEPAEQSRLRRRVLNLRAPQPQGGRGNHQSRPASCAALISRSA